ncbi:MAG TPA: GAF domain-containing protein [Acetobacteraceae bacterium]|nr:GAF domain-containing protein [Acetobacteraceae bacterium]
MATTQDDMITELQCDNAALQERLDESHAERDAALAREVALAEVVDVINRSSGNLAPVFEVMLEKAMRLCEAACGGLFTYDGERFHTVAARGVPAAMAKFRGKNPPTVQLGGHVKRLLETRRPVHVLDWMEEETYRNGDIDARAIVDLGGARTNILVPLLKEEAVVGFFGLYRQEVRAFTDEQIALLQNFAAQAVIGVENARLLGELQQRTVELQESLEYQTAASDVLKVINASAGDLERVFDTVLEKAVRLCESSFGVLVTYDGECFHTAAMREVAPGLADAIREPVRPSPGMAYDQIAQGADIVHIADITGDDVYRSGNRIRRALADQGGARTALFVALRRDEALFGAFVIYRKQVRPFSDRQIALLQNFAAQAVIAMENARLITEQREALEQQTATAEVLQVINASPGDLALVFDAMLEKAMRLCGAAFGVLWTYDGERMHAAALRGVPPAFAEFLTQVTHQVGPNNAHGRLLRGEPIVHIADVLEDEAYLSGDPIRRTLVELGGGRTLLAVPLRKDETFLGDFVIYRTRVQPFSDKQIALLQSFAGQAVIAMENARLLDEVHQRQAELRITFENMGDGVAMFDETPRLVAWNRKFQDILDLPDGVLAERLTFAEYVRYLTERGEYGVGADPEEQIRRLTENADQYRSYERVRPDGRVIEIHHNPVPGGGFVLIYADITERKHNEAELRAARDAAEEASRTIEAAYRDLKAAQANLIQAEKMASLGQLTAGIAHEIKNPLNFVNNFAALSVDLLAELKETAAPGFAVLSAELRAEVEDVSAMLTSNLQKITEHGKRADGIVKAMLEHSRGSSGERRMVDLNALIDEALNLAYHGARAQDQSFNITLERDFCEGIAPIEVNPQDMTRVFLNLFANGFYAVTRRAQHSGDPAFVPTLKVTTQDAGEAVEIRVRDNGSGIPADIRDKLFQPFFTTKPTGEGTGLGLSITYDIVTQQHGGSITADSKVGEYSEFTIRLPRNA